MDEPKFKVGDKVKAIANIEQGLIGEITQTIPGYTNVYRINFPHWWAKLSECQIEKI